MYGSAFNCTDISGPRQRAQICYETLKLVHFIRVIVAADHGTGIHQNEFGVSRAGSTVIDTNRTLAILRSFALIIGQGPVQVVKKVSATQILSRRSASVIFRPVERSARNPVQGRSTSGDAKLPGQTKQEHGGNKKTGHSRSISGREPRTRGRRNAVRPAPQVRDQKRQSDEQNQDGREGENQERPAPRFGQDSFAILADETIDDLSIAFAARGQRLHFCTQLRGNRRIVHRKILMPAARRNKSRLDAPHFVGFHSFAEAPTIPICSSAYWLPCFRTQATIFIPGRGLASSLRSGTWNSLRRVSPWPEAFVRIDGGDFAVKDEDGLAECFDQSLPEEEEYSHLSPSFL